MGVSPRLNGKKSWKRPYDQKCLTKCFFTPPPQKKNSCHEVKVPICDLLLSLHNAERDPLQGGNTGVR